jgi:hypothetical protein
MSDQAQKGRVSADILNIMGAAVAILTVVGAGAGLSAALPNPTPWLSAAAWLAPPSLAFAAYWWMAQRL